MIKRIIFAVLLTFNAYSSTTIQILHTNDLHSFLNGPSPSHGGYFRIKTAIDQLKANALRKGIQTITLDGGDFGEGSYLFLHDQGISSLKAFDLLGIDAAVLGNHDYMFGGPTLSDQIIQSGLRTKILGANIAYTDEMRLKGIIHPHATFNINGKSIFVLGLTTGDPHFKYALGPGNILPEIPVSRAYTKVAKDDGHDLVIALTHLGLNKDIKLIKKDPNLDLVIGGHSHTRLDEIYYQTNQNGKNIPIVQTGAHGVALGRIIIELPENGDPIIKEYELVDMNQYIARDPDVLASVNKIESDAQYNLSQGRWRDYVTESEIDWGGYNNGVMDYADRCWYEHVGKMLKQESQSDASLYLTNFMGEKISKGPIKYGDIIRNFPHINEYGKEGWEIMKIKMTGWQILSLMTGVVNVGAIGKQVIFGGIEYNSFKIPDFIPWIGGKTFFTKFHINGKRVSFKSRYEVALPYELKKLLEGVLSKKLVSYLNLGAVRNEYYLWPMAHRYLSGLESVKCL